MTKEKIKKEIINYLIKIQTKLVLSNFKDHNILLLENFKKLKFDFIEFFKEFEKEIYSEEYFIINIRRISRFFKKNLVMKIILFLEKIKNHKKFSKKEKMKFHIKFLVFVI